MDQPQHKRKELKLQAIAQLERARVELVQQSMLASTQWSPSAVIQRSFHRHRIAWIAGAAVAGVALFRLVSSRFKHKNGRDNEAKPASNRSLAGLFAVSLIPLARKAAFAYGQKWFKDYLSKKFSQTDVNTHDPQSSQ